MADSGDKKTSVLFICLGNICRSPMGEAIFQAAVKERRLASKFRVESAGILDIHLGKGPNHRTLEILARHGITDYRHDVRQVTSGDFAKYDFIWAMDDDNMADLRGIEKYAKDKRATVELFSRYDPEGVRQVPDPYYESGVEQFEDIYHQLKRCCDGFLAQFS